MSKVLVDRELLDQLQEKLDPHRDAVLWGEVCDAIRRAQPAEAEVDCGDPEHGEWVKDNWPCPTCAALSSVTAERDRLRSKWARVESERDQYRAEVERWKIHASNWESVAHKQDRRLKDILRGLASDKALSVFPVPWPERQFPVPCEVIHDDDVLLVIHQRDAAMAAKEA